MKNLILVFLFVATFSFVNKAQSLYCGGICISNIWVGSVTTPILEQHDSVSVITGDTIYYNLAVPYHWLKVSMFGVNAPDTINYPIVVVVDTVHHDTVGNKLFQNYSFYQYADSVVVDSVLTLLDSVPFNLKGYVMLIDKLTHDTCRYPYPMNCTNTAVKEQKAIVNKLTIYPNPASSEINISINNINHQQATINLYDDTGQLTKTYITTSNLLTINREGLANGIYFITADIGNERLNNKLVIQ